MGLHSIFTRCLAEMLYCLKLVVAWPGTQNFGTVHHCRWFCCKNSVLSHCFLAKLAKTLDGPNLWGLRSAGGLTGCKKNCIVVCLGQYGAVAVWDCFLDSAALLVVLLQTCCTVPKFS